MKFSVLMSIYVRERPERFDRAMQSIWDEQTRKPDQIVLVKDGPLPSELDDVIDTWREKLGDILVVVPLEHNVGLGAALNKGLEHCIYDLVARMDSDDISLPHRFEQQVAFMRDNPDVAVSSAWIEEINDQGDVFSIRTLPANHEELSIFARKRSPIAHPVAVFKRKAVLAAGGYPSLRKSQDYGLWARLLVQGYRMANIQEVLYRMQVGNVFSSGRGVEQLRNEWAMFRFQKRIGFIGWPALIRNVGVRCVLRLSPCWAKKVLYKIGRK